MDRRDGEAFERSTGYGKKATQRCPCGYYGDQTRECTCSPTMVSRYQKRISGPLMDRIDIHVEVPRVDVVPEVRGPNDKLADDRLGELSEVIRRHVEAAQTIQQRRFEGTSLTCNADMGVAEVREFCGMGSKGRRLLRAVQQQLGMSAHAFRPILNMDWRTPSPCSFPPRLLQSADSDAHSALPRTP